MVVWPVSVRKGNGILHLHPLCVSLGLTGRSEPSFLIHVNPVTSISEAA